MVAEGGLAGGVTLGVRPLPARNKFTISLDGWSGGNCTSSKPFLARLVERTCWKVPGCMAFVMWAFQAHSKGEVGMPRATEVEIAACCAASAYETMGHDYSIILLFSLWALLRTGQRMALALCP